MSSLGEIRRNFILASNNVEPGLKPAAEFRFHGGKWIMNYE
jgi:hypothetical protein